MRLFDINRDGIFFGNSHEGCGLQLTRNDSHLWFDFEWCSYGIDRIDKCRYYSRRRLCIVRFAGLKLWMDLGRISVVRYREPDPYEDLYHGTNDGSSLEE